MLNRTSVVVLLVVSSCAGGVDELPADELEADELAGLTAAQKGQAVRVIQQRLLDFELSSYGTAAQREAAADRLFAVAAANLKAQDPDTGEFANDVDDAGRILRRHDCRALMTDAGVGWDHSGNPNNNVGSCLEAQYIKAGQMLASALQPPATFADPTRDAARFAKLYPAAVRAIDGAAELTDEVYRRFAVIERNNSKETNWFYWQIGLPRGATRTLFLLHMVGRANPSRSTAVAARVSRIVASLSRRGLLGAKVHTLGFGAGYHWSGANLAWNTQAHLFVGLATGDADRLASVRNAMELSAQMQSLMPGIQPDYSYRFHNPSKDGGLESVSQLYIGGYGEAEAELLSQYMFVTEPTAFRLRNVHTAGVARAKNEYRTNFIRLVLTGARASYRGILDPVTRGRHLAHGNFALSGYTNAMVLMATVPVAGAPAWQREVQAELGVALARPEVASRLDPKYRAMLDGADRSGWAAPRETSLFVHYPYVDYSMLRRPDFFLSQRMLSSRMLAGESYDDGNMLGARQADGRYMLALEGGEYAMHDTTAAIDWKMLPGITVLYRRDAADAFTLVGKQITPQYRSNESPIAGAVSDGVSGVSAFQLDSRNTGLVAKKSTFFFEDAVAFLVADVACPGCSGEVSSVVQQWPLLKAGTAGERPISIAHAGGVATLPQTQEVGAVIDGQGGVSFIDSRWVVADGVGYFFPQPEDVKLRIKKELACIDLLQREADEKPNVDAGRPLPVRPSDSVCKKPAGLRPFLTVWVDHGPGQALTKRSTAWVVVPRASEAVMAQWQTQSPLTVLRNDATAAAVSYRRGDALTVGLVAWPQQGTFRPVTLPHAELGAVTLSGVATVQLKKRGSTLGVAAAYPRLSPTTVKLTLDARYRVGTLPPCASKESASAPFVLQLKNGASCTFVLTDSHAPTTAAPEPAAPAELNAADDVLAEPEPELGIDGADDGDDEPFAPQSDDE